MIDVNFNLILLRNIYLKLRNYSRAYQIFTLRPMVADLYGGGFGRI